MPRQRRGSAPFRLLSLSFPFPSLSQAGFPGHGTGGPGSAGAVRQRRLPGAERAAAAAAGPALGRAAGGRAAGCAALHAGAAARPGGGGGGRGGRGGGHQPRAAVPGARRGLPGAVRAAAPLQVPPEGLLPQPAGQVRGSRHRGGLGLGHGVLLRGKELSGKALQPFPRRKCSPPVSFYFICECVVAKEADTGGGFTALGRGTSSPVHLPGASLPVGTSVLGES